VVKNVQLPTRTSTVVAASSSGRGAVIVPRTMPSPRRTAAPVVAIAARRRSSPSRATVVAAWSEKQVNDAAKSAGSNVGAAPTTSKRLAGSPPSQARRDTEVRALAAAVCAGTTAIRGTWVAAKA